MLKVVLATRAQRPYERCWGWFGAAVAAALFAVGVAGATAAGGQLDPSFGRGGKVMTSFADASRAAPEAVALQPDGKIVVVGTKGGESVFHPVLVRYTTAGKLDRSFGRGGTVVTHFGRNRETASDVAIQPDRKIVVTGRSGIDETGGFALARYTTRGALDPTFGKGGRAVSDLPGDDESYALARQLDGKFVVAGRGGGDEEQSDIAVARFTADGRLDTSFGSGGTTITDFGGTDDVWDVALQPDGKIVLAGESQAEDGKNLVLARYTTSGTLDATFGNGGKVVTDVGGVLEAALAVAIQRDGKIIAAGFGGTEDFDFALVRYTARGLLDGTFGSGGTVLTDVAAREDDGAAAVAVQQDGKIIAAGDNGKDFALVRYTTTGRLDPSFGARGKVLTDFGAMESVADIELQKDGKIIAAGGDFLDFTLARYMR